MQLVRRFGPGDLVSKARNVQWIGDTLCIDASKHPKREDVSRKAGNSVDETLFTLEPTGFEGLELHFVADIETESQHKLLILSTAYTERKFWISKSYHLSFSSVTIEEGTVRNRTEEDSRASNGKFKTLDAALSFGKKLPKTDSIRLGISYDGVGLIQLKNIELWSFIDFSPESLSGGGRPKFDNRHDSAEITRPV